MAQNVEFVLDGKEAGAVRAWLAVQRAQESAAASLDKVGSAQEKVNRIDQAYAKVKGEALRVLESLRTAEERRTKNIQSLADAQKLGIITGDEYRVGMERLHQQMNAGDASFTATESRLGLVTKGFVAAAAAAAAFATANREAQGNADSAADSVDELRRKWQVQSGLEGDMLNNSFAAIEKNAKENAVTPQVAYTSAIQLTSSGTDAAVAASTGLDAFLEGLSATNAAGANVDQRALAEAVVSYLNSQKMDATAGNIKSVMSQSQRLFKGTNFQLPDLQALAVEGAALKTSLRSDEQFAALSVLRDAGMPGAQGATNLRNITSRLQTARTEKNKVEALRRLKLKPDDVDFVGEGEDLDTVLGRLQTGIQNVPQKDRAGILKTIFGEEGLAGVQTLMDNRPKMAKAIELQRNVGQYEKDVEIAQSGRSAALQRVETDKLLIDAERGRKEGMDKVNRLAVSNELKNRGVSDLVRNVAVDGQIPLVSQFTGPMSVYDLLRSSGMTPEGAADWSATSGTIFKSGEHQQAEIGVKNRVREAQFGPMQAAPEQIRVGNMQPRPASIPDPLMVEQNALLREGNSLARQQLQANAINMNRPLSPDGIRADTRPASPVLSAANDDRNNQRP